MPQESTPFSADFAKQIIEFNFWENRRVWDEAILPLTDAQFTTDTGYSWGTIQRECVHIMNGEWGWLQRIHSTPQPRDRFAFEDYVDRQIIRQQWDEIQAAWQQLSAQLDTDYFFSECEFEFRGKQVSMPRWKPIFHVMSHGTLHRTEILHMVAEVHEPIDFDLSMMQYLTGAFR